MKSPPKNKSKQPSLPEIEDYVTWFEIPANNFDRAVTFYNKVYQIEMHTSAMSGYQMAYFPAKTGIGGAVIAGEGSMPSDRGPLLYLNAGKDLDGMLRRIEEAGGRVLLPKTHISDSAGHFALFIDSEGNKLALHTKS